jgi:L-glutamine-phosphate cytidylyltransferase
MTQVIILNSGTGSRMGELTTDRPKCLVELTGGETILSRQLSLLAEFGLKEFVITTGPFEEKIKAHLEGRFEDLCFTYINNPRYRDTNYIYSMFLAEGVVKSDVILLHGDMVFEREVIKKLLAAPHSDTVLIDSGVELPEKDFKAQITGGLVRKIGVDVFGAQAVSLQPVYRFSKESFSTWLAEINCFVKDDNMKVYAENALNNLLNELALHPLELNGKFCMEIDDESDLEVARSFLMEGAGKS